MAVGKAQRNSSGREPRNASGRTYRNTAAAAIACCCVVPCPMCSGATPEVWEVVFAGITKCPDFVGIGGDPNTTFPDVAHLAFDPAGCTWEENNFPTNACGIGIDDDGMGGGVDSITVEHTDFALGGGGFEWFSSDEVPFVSDCESVVVVDNDVTVSGDCGNGGVFGYGGTATLTPQFPP